MELPPEYRGNSYCGHLKSGWFVCVWIGWAGENNDDFVKNPISALRFISSASGGLRRTVSTPRDARFARLELGLFTKSSAWMTFYEFINNDEFVKSLFGRHPGESRGPCAWKQARAGR